MNDLSICPDFVDLPGLNMHKKDSFIFKSTSSYLNPSNLFALILKGR